MSRLWYIATQSPVETRIAFWVGLVVIFFLSSFLPSYALGVLVRVALMGAAFAVLGMALQRGQGRVFRIILWTILGCVLFFGGIAALYR